MIVLDFLQDSIHTLRGVNAKRWFGRIIDVGQLQTWQAGYYPRISN